MTHTIRIRSGLIGPLLIGLVSVLACGAVFASGLELWLQLLLIPGVLLSTLHAWRNWPIHRRWKRIVTRQDGFLQLLGPENQKVVVEPTPRAFLSPIFIAFAVREAEGRSFWIAGFYDQFDGSDYRKLLSWMRFSS